MSYLAVSEGNGLRLVSAHVIVYTLLELPGYEGSILPAALRVGQALPLAQVVWVACCRLLVGMPCSEGIQVIEFISYMPFESCETTGIIPFIVHHLL